MMPMDWNRVEGNWKEVKGKVKEKWGKLTDDDLTAINGQRDQLEGRLQQRYGYAKDQTLSTSSAGCLERLCIRCLDIPSLPRLLLSCVSDIAWGPNTVPLFVPPLSPLGPLCSPKAKGKGE